MSINYEEDSGTTRADARVVMERVSEMVRLRNAAEQRVLQAQEELKRQEQSLRKIECEDIPELMRGAGLESVTTSDGTVVKIVDEIACGISEDRRPAAHQWLREHDCGGVIRSEVVVVFGRDELGEKDDFYLACVREHGVDNVVQKESVHYQTLKALLKELRSKAAEQPAMTPPGDLFGIVPYSIAKCKAPGAKKSGRL